MTPIKTNYIYFLYSWGKTHLIVVNPIIMSFFFNDWVIWQDIHLVHCGDPNASIGKSIQGGAKTSDRSMKDGKNIFKKKQISVGRL